jgi:hypothetical protein
MTMKTMKRNQREKVTSDGPCEKHRRDDEYQVQMTRTTNIATTSDRKARGESKPSTSHARQQSMGKGAVWDRCLTPASDTWQVGCRSWHWQRRQEQDDDEDNNKQEKQDSGTARDMTTTSRQ